MVLLPTPLKAFTDTMPEVKAMLRICGRSLYGWECDHESMKETNAALDDWEAQVRHKVVNALAAIPDKSSVKPLLKIYQRKDEEQYVRNAALRALGNISDQSVVRALRNDLRM